MACVRGYSPGQPAKQRKWARYRAMANELSHNAAPRRASSHAPEKTRLGGALLGRLTAQIRAAPHLRRAAHPAGATAVAVDAADVGAEMIVVAAVAQAIAV